MDYMSIIGNIVGVVGLAYAFIESRQRKKIVDHIRSHNWAAYFRADVATGHLQHAKARYLIAHRGHIDADVLDLLSRGDGFSQEVFKECIRQIGYFEPSFTAKDFERWRKEGKISADKIQLFMRLAVDPGPALLPNEAPEPTVRAVTPLAAQEPRQP